MTSNFVTTFVHPNWPLCRTFMRKRRILFERMNRMKAKTLTLTIMGISHSHILFSHHQAWLLSEGKNPYGSHLARCLGRYPSPQIYLNISIRKGGSNTLVSKNRSWLGAFFGQPYCEFLPKRGLVNHDFLDTWNRWDSSGRIPWTWLLGQNWMEWEATWRGSKVHLAIVVFKVGLFAYFLPNFWLLFVPRVH